MLRIFRCQYHTCFGFAYSSFLVIHSGLNCVMLYLHKAKCSMLCSWTSHLVINWPFFPLKLIFISWPYFYFVIKFQCWLKYKIYSSLIKKIILFLSLVRFPRTKCLKTAPETFRKGCLTVQSSRWMVFNQIYLWFLYTHIIV